MTTHQQPRHLWDYWGTIMKRLWLVLIFVISSLIVAWFVTRNQEPQYRATATIEILPPTMSGPEMMYAPAIFTDDRYLDTQVEKLRMPQTIERAVANGKLANLPEFKGKTDAVIAQMAAGHVEVSLRRNKLLLDVSVVGSDPRGLPHLTNALVQEFRSMQRSETKVRRETARTDLEWRIGKLDRVIVAAQLDKKYRLESLHYNEQTFGYVYDLETGRLTDFTKKRDDVGRELSQKRVLNQAFKSAREAPDSNVDALAQIPEVRQDPQVLALQREIDALSDRKQQLIREGMGAAIEQFRSLEQEIEQRTKARNRVVLQVVDGFLLTYRGMVENFLDLSKELDAIDSKVKEVVQLKGLVDEKNAEIERAKDEIALLNKRLEPILRSALEEQDSVSITQSAKEPTEPFSPNTTANLTLGAVIGVLGGIALAFMLDYLDDTIRTKDELAKVADVPLLGVVPNIGRVGGDSKKRDLYAHEQPKSTISEAYRGVRTALTLSTHGPSQKALLLTSAGPREGKTTTAINLATVLAYSGGRTLLIDADLRKPRIHKAFDLPNVAGLTNLIVGNDDPLTLCLPTVVDRVDVLPSGPIPPNPSELLGNPKMREVLRRLREKYDHIILDTPPIGAVTDAAVLATMVDGVILVVHAGKTRRQIVMRGIEQLRHVNATIVGVILNNLHIGRARYYPGYYHYYYYYSSHYGADDAPAKEPKQKVATLAPPAAAVASAAPQSPPPAPAAASAPTANMSTPSTPPGSKAVTSSAAAPKPAESRPAPPPGAAVPAKPAVPQAEAKSEARSPTASSAPAVPPAKSEPPRPQGGGTGGGEA